MLCFVRRKALFCETNCIDMMSKHHPPLPFSLSLIYIYMDPCYWIHLILWNIIESIINLICFFCLNIIALTILSIWHLLRVFILLSLITQYWYHYFCIKLQSIISVHPQEQIRLDLERPLCVLVSHKHKHHTTLPILPSTSVFNHSNHIFHWLLCQ